jgi:hypothetical protein
VHLRQLDTIHSGNFINSQTVTNNNKDITNTIDNTNTHRKTAKEPRTGYQQPVAATEVTPAELPY